VFVCPVKHESVFGQTTRRH